ncbi:MAG TPA: division/cell wall cluster transcriptional repressor MraZ [Casimicrobium sp.]|jgi:MraZ protein|nr:division/cell wall cluster transcriptional repressor MraZ [Casimicrobium sp.]
MFTGASNLSLDVKGRLTIPTRYREALGTHVVLTGDPSGCLLLFTQHDWVPFEEYVCGLPVDDKTTKPLKRVWLGCKMECEIDGAGRLLLPPELRDHARLERKVQMIGQEDRFELWSEAGWLEQKELARRIDRDGLPATYPGNSA